MDDVGAVYHGTLMDRSRRQFAMIAIACSLWPAMLVVGAMIHWLTGGVTHSEWLLHLHAWTSIESNPYRPSPVWTIVQDVLQSYQAVFFMMFGLALLLNQRRWWTALSVLFAACSVGPIIDRYVYGEYFDLFRATPPGWVYTFGVATEGVTLLLSDAIVLLQPMLVVFLTIRLTQGVKEDAIAAEVAPIAETAPRSSSIGASTESIAVLQYQAKQDATATPGATVWWAVGFIAILNVLRVAGEGVDTVNGFRWAYNGTFPVAGPFLPLGGRDLAVFLRWDQLSECFYRIGWLALFGAFARWRSESQPSRNWIGLAAVALAAWGVAESISMGLAPHTGYTVGGQPAMEVAMCLRIVSLQVSIPLLLLLAAPQRLSPSTT